MKIWLNFNHLKFHSWNLAMIEGRISHYKHLLFHVTKHNESLHGIWNENQYEFFDLVSL